MLNISGSRHTYAAFMLLLFAGLSIQAGMAGQAVAQTGPAEQNLSFVNAYESDDALPATAANASADLPSPAGALLRSFVLPGWGQYYADSDNWRRGQYHLGADLALLGSWIYLRTNANLLQNNMYSHASAYAGINLRDADRNIEIAVGSSNSLDSYNQTQLRNRNWDRLIDSNSGIYWNWDTEDRRGEYLRMRDRRDRAEQQIPAIATMMVVNRIVSGVHSFIVARNQHSVMADTQIGFSLPELSNGQGFQASVMYRF